MTERLTAEEFEVLDFMVTFSNTVGWWLNNGNSQFWTQHMNEFNGLCDIDYLIDGSDSYQITDTGRKALAAYKAQRDMVLFIAEFEEWLEAEVDKFSEFAIATQKQSRIFQACTLATVLEKYRQCKQRIEQPHDAQ